MSLSEPAFPSWGLQSPVPWGSSAQRSYLFAGHRWATGALARGRRGRHSESGPVKLAGTHEADRTERDALHVHPDICVRFVKRLFCLTITKKSYF